MRSPALAAAVFVATVTACSDSGSPAVADAALERDLRLASTSSLALLPTSVTGTAQLETAPPTTLAPANRPRRAASGPRHIASSRPTVRVARVAVSEPVSGDAPAIGEAPEAVESEANVELAGGVALPRPVPVSVGLPTVGDYDTPRGPSAGDIFGAVIRGGDIDDCKIHDDRNRRRPDHRPGSVGVGGSRWPVARREPVRTGGTEGRRAGRWPVGARQ